MSSKSHTEGHRLAPVIREPLVCIECRRPWLDGRERWQLKLTDDPTPEAVPYCAACGEREFGGS